MAAIAILYTTVAKRTDARKLSRALLDTKAIACSVALDAESAYTWAGKRERSNEVALICKTSVRALARARKTIEKTHPYKTPCILSWTVDANDAYAAWVANWVR
jgi:uncharacterized protein involved in tolerance to divalent cations